MLSEFFEWTNDFSPEEGFDGEPVTDFFVEIFEFGDSSEERSEDVLLADSFVDIVEADVTFGVVVWETSAVAAEEGIDDLGEDFSAPTLSVSRLLVLSVNGVVEETESNDPFFTLVSFATLSETRVEEGLFPEPSLFFAEKVRNSGNDAFTSGRW